MIHFPSQVHCSCRNPFSLNLQRLPWSRNSVFIYVVSSMNFARGRLQGRNSFTFFLIFGWPTSLGLRHFLLCVCVCVFPPWLPKSSHSSSSFLETFRPSLWSHRHNTRPEDGVCLFQVLCLHSEISPLLVQLVFGRLWVKTCPVVLSQLHEVIISRVILRSMTTWAPSFFVA